HDEAVEVGNLRPPRRGLENAPELQRLLDRYVGPAYQGEEEDAALRSLGSLLLLILMMGGFLLITLYVMRWAGGGGGPFSFGRSKHKLYAEKDLRVSFS